MSASINELLAERATGQSADIAYRFLRDGETDEDVLSYEALEKTSRVIGTLLQQRMRCGERVLVLHLPGFEFIKSFFGCLRARMIAVPVHPPERVRGEHSAARLRHIIRDCTPTTILTTSEIFARRAEIAQTCPEIASLAWIVTDSPASVAEHELHEGDARGDTIALLQYTSGSTAAPRGVVLSHAQILANQRLIAARMRTRTGDIGCGWLPLYHDMGMIGLLLHTLYAGIETVLFSPLHFLQQPLRWLSAISRYRATISGGPSFGYELCLRRMRLRRPSEALLATLDLSSWDVAFNGAEPVRADVLEDFAATFARYGFRRDAFLPCYGLAEATLFVTGGRRLKGPTVINVDRAGLERHRVERAAADAPSVRRLVSSGAVPKDAEDTRVIIVDPESMAPRGDGHVGEVWVKGPSVAPGYWRSDDEGRRNFAATTADGRSGFLRTGDLGFILDGELFITGRLKEMMIVHGRNIYPQDVERVAQESHRLLRSGGGAAIGVMRGDEERLVLVQEVLAEDGIDFGQVIDTMRFAVARELQVQLSAVALVPPKAIPKTPSGKIQRRVVATSYGQSRLRVLAEWQDGR